MVFADLNNDLAGFVGGAAQAAVDLAESFPLLSDSWVLYPEFEYDAGRKASMADAKVVVVAPLVKASDRGRFEAWCADAARGISTVGVADRDSAAALAIYKVRLLCVCSSCSWVTTNIRLMRTVCAHTSSLFWPQSRLEQGILDVHYDFAENGTLLSSSLVPSSNELQPDEQAPKIFLPVLPQARSTRSMLWSAAWSPCGIFFRFPCPTPSTGRPACQGGVGNDDKHLIILGR